MHIYMTLQAVREFFQNYFTMRLTMAFLALWNIFVLGMMALCTGYLPVLAGRSLYFVIDRGMTGAAYLVLHRVRIDDFERRMDRVASQTILYCLLLRMGLVTFHARWNKAVLCMVT
jgi:hypothetical protein